MREWGRVSGSFDDYLTGINVRKQKGNPMMLFNFEYVTKSAKVLLFCQRYPKRLFLHREKT